jgi:hypothetical protein
VHALSLSAQDARGPEDTEVVVPVVQTWVESAMPWVVIPGIRAVAWKDFDYASLAREWAATAPQFG